MTELATQYIVAEEMTMEELTANENIISRGLATFKEVGAALLEIRDRRGYRFGYSTFEDYCRESWGFSKTHANRLISASEVVCNLAPIGVTPETESQARPLAALNDQPNLQREAWQRAVETAPGGNVTAAHVQTVVDSMLGKANRDDSFDRDDIAESEPQGQPEHTPHVARNTGNNEWYTPSEYIKAARKVLGKIDLDPASSEIANRTVQAKKIYTVSDNGLGQDWRGKVWMNPPYSSDLIGKFCEKLAYHYSNDDVTEAIVLVNNATETAWFNSLVSVGAAIVFPSSRVKFLDHNGDPVGAPLQGQAVIYIGGNKDKFMDAYRSFGWCATL